MKGRVAARLVCKSVADANHAFVADTNREFAAESGEFRGILVCVLC